MACALREAVGKLASSLSQVTLTTACRSAVPRSHTSLAAQPRPLHSWASSSLLPASQRTSSATHPQPLTTPMTTASPTLLAVNRLVPTMVPSRGFHVPASSSAMTAASSSLLAVSRLAPTPTTVVVPRRGYHVRLVLKKRCSGCYFKRRKGRLFMDCKLKPRHKLMQLMSFRKVWKEDYSEGKVERAIHWNYAEEKRYYKLGDTPYARHDWLQGKIGVTV